MAKDKRSKAPGPPATASAAPAAVPPSWPPFKPALPVVDLALESLVQDKVVVLRSFFPRSLCKDYVSFLRELPLVTTPGKPKRGEALRVNDRYQIDDARFAHRLWTETGLKEALLSKDVARLWGGEVVGLNPNIRIYRYSPGQFFDAHYDDSNNVTLKPETGPALPARTTWTLLLYLTSSADGWYVLSPVTPHHTAPDQLPPPFPPLRRNPIITGQHPQPGHHFPPFLRPLRKGAT
ncbi:uncharacterized protein THITE_2111836 [Thermothielavioides terrestris NRRL 8126]|uniref:Prolyl 4-hydroxylase alpha subunit domain-containing protein n=1 Tax=Thermothielavioides terrestris (strain ATCC 38088 / NRRL 8126) TaxID=578455 RepID=G2R3N9_THETT|nr:uncharacterized protein THITE_2111836 [Thermothielavioides terrestris NRRL 8126]AEO65139.1 hypothetical protein THITE_2111836 [Thermothielavioides terrestris NRRL 8126]